VSHPAKINSAIRECLDDLLPGLLPVAHLANFLERLRADPKWSEYEINEVDAGVRRILADLVDERQ
jgi:hypothetical protein